MNTRSGRGREWPQAAHQARGGVQGTVCSFWSFNPPLGPRGPRPGPALAEMSCHLAPPRTPPITTPLRQQLRSGVRLPLRLDNYNLVRSRPSRAIRISAPAQLGGRAPSSNHRGSRGRGSPRIRGRARGRRCWADSTEDRDPAPRQASKLWSGVTQKLKAQPGKPGPGSQVWAHWALRTSLALPAPLPPP